VKTGKAARKLWRLEKNGSETAISGWKNGNLYYTVVEKLLELSSVVTWNIKMYPKNLRIWLNNC